MRQHVAFWPGWSLEYVAQFPKLAGGLAMPTIHVGLVSQSGVSLAELSRLANACNIQIARDFGPIWDVDAVITAFESLEDVPAHFWPVVIHPYDLTPEPVGMHKVVEGNPVCFIKHTDTWGLVVSHEILEMIGDPDGDYVIEGPGLNGEGYPVEYLVEVSDPCQHEEFAYIIDDVLVSDFILPDYYSAEDQEGKFSFTGAVKRPREVLTGGYVSWHDPVKGRWYQQVSFIGRFFLRDLGAIEKHIEHVRNHIDMLTPRHDQEGVVAEHEAKQADLQLRRG